MNPDFDLIVFGATGFTGRLVAEYLQARGATRWAIAGRNAAKLAAVRDELGLPKDLPLLQADAGDAAALRALVARTRVVISTVGPYQLHGEPLVTACAEAGTDYVDLCGEPLWMARMIDKLTPLAQQSGARIVFSCGFDSIPFDLGVVYLQAQAQERLGAPLREVRARMARMKGAASGGTLASMMETFEAIRREPALGQTMSDPFALTPGFKGPTQPDDQGAALDDWADLWAGPFVMAAINTKNVHRSNALRGHPWGRDFVYSEKMLTGRPGTPDKGAKKAQALARMTRWQNRVLGFGPARALLRRFVLTQPGDGPNKAAREAGHYEVWFSGKSASGELLRAIVKGDRDPGYGSTCKLISEAALCLVEDIPRSATPGGVWTPGSAMGLALVRRLHERAGLTFEMAAQSRRNP
ncbi:saccharopine dehydrogenase family protein [Inhella proteolytica]|uniref:Saccharopine dehydrogenase NADP-binding domain-containing protein n=1 Tax=Inhella proteolytica TaxID=2795029 RepID=A0A931J4Z3_9BURK|nr:saccharopine dehydrogenase NADP-binding domain-containing protein [Inhella proteolytica]MBH9576957.1 saccharopine dehydrogenase NADP-binding domain-containing protein [Inhella proteolytica]